MQLWHHHITRAEEKINSAAWLGAADRDQSTVFTLLGNRCVRRHADVRDGAGRHDTGLVRKLVDKGTCFLDAVLLVIGVEGHREDEGVLATHDLQLAHHLHLKHGALSGQQVSQLDGQCLVFLFAFGDDSCITSGNGIIVLLLRLLLVLDLGDYDLVVKGSLEASQDARLLDREGVSALEGALCARVDVGELDAGVSCGSSELSLDFDLGEGEDDALVFDLCIQAILAAALPIVAGLGCDELSFSSLLLL